MSAAKKAKPVTPANQYLGDIHRRRMVARRAFAPGQTRVFQRQTLAGGIESCLNMWVDLTRLFGTIPDADLEKHVRDSDWWALIDVLCGTGTQEERENARRLRFYMAMIVGAVSVKPGHNPLLMGKQGTGKEQIWAPLIQVLGPERSINVSQHMFNGTFNAWMMNRLVMMPEVRRTTRGTATDHDQYTALKRMCDPGREYDNVNEKHIKAINVQNVFVLVMTTNEDQPMTLPEDDRRVWVIQVKEHDWDNTRHQNLAAWFRAPSPWGETNAHVIVEWLIRFWDAGIMLDEVLGPAPMTRDKLDLIERGAGAVLTWLRDTLGREIPDPLTLPDVFTSGYVVDRLTQAIRGGGQGVGPGVRVPSADGMGRYLVKAGCRKLNDGKATGHALPGADLVKIWDTLGH
jgi:hypothetical protein